MAALADALRGIDKDLAPCRRASVVALREQVYFGWEQPMARGRGGPLIFGKYEAWGWWSDAAAALVGSGAALRGTRQLERDHVEPLSQIVADLLEVPRTAEETAELLEQRLITCTVLAEEHRRLGRTRGDGWARYDAAGITYRYGLDPDALPWDERNGPEDSEPESDEEADSEPESDEKADSAPEWDEEAHLDRIQSKEELNVSDVATLLYRGRVTFEEAKALLGEIEVQHTPRMTPEQIAVGYEGYWEDNDPRHLSWLSMNSFLTYDQLTELILAMKSPANEGPEQTSAPDRDRDGRAEADGSGA